MRKAFIIAIVNQQLQKHNIDKRFFVDIITPDIFDNILYVIENMCGTLTTDDYNIIIAYLEK